MSPGTLLASCRFVHDSSLMALWGAFAYLALLVPPVAAESILRRLRGLRLVATVFVVVTAVLALPLQAAMIGDGWQDAINGQLLSDVVTSTTIGTVWLAQMGGALALTLAQVSLRRLRPVAIAMISGLTLASLALGGHAATEDGWDGVVHPLNDALHVLAAGAWFGALLPLFVLLSRSDGSSFQEGVSIALRRFSAAGHWAVAIAILTGIANSFFIVGWPLDWTSAYRVLLTAKIAVVLLMTTLAILNRYWFVPGMDRNREAAVAAMRRGIVVEIALGLAAILLVSIFGILDPQASSITDLQG